MNEYWMLDIGGPWTIGIGAVLASLALGFVTIMMTVVGRTAFRVLPEEHALTFLRAAFPVYYALLILFTALGSALLALTHPYDAGVLACVALLALFGRFWLMPIAHRIDDLRREGQDMQSDLTAIQKRTSFVVVVQFFALAAVVARLAVLPWPKILSVIALGMNEP